VVVQQIEIDENRYAGQELPITENLAAALFGLENSQAPEVP
jgi:hypothetical protein